MNFNTAEDGGDVTVIVGEAKILGHPPPTGRAKTYLRKYRRGISSLGMTVAKFSAAYTVPIIVTPQVLRGFVD